MSRRMLMSAVLVAALPLTSQTGPPASRPGRAARVRAYEVAREATLHGTVEEVVVLPGGRSSGVHLRVASEGKAWEVHLAPAWFLEQRKWTFAKGDELDLVGAKAGSGAGEHLIAREVKRGGQVLVLRDAAGVPMWSRRGPGPR